MQVLPFYDEGAIRTLRDFEELVYQKVRGSPQHAATANVQSTTGKMQLRFKTDLTTVSHQSGFIRSGNHSLLMNGEADQAEAVFRADLEQCPRNPRSLFGLLKSLEAQKKTSDANWVRREFEAAWKSADVALELGDL
jgi:hypothetical protein